MAVFAAAQKHKAAWAALCEWVCVAWAADRFAFLCHRRLLKRQLHGGQVAAGFHQHQRTFIDHYHWGAFAWHAHGLGLRSNRGLYGGDLVRIRVHPLQAR